MSKLLEADYLYVDINKLLNKKPIAANEPTIQKTPAVPLDKNTNWAAELAKRISENRTKSPETRIDEFNIESDFFKEFYSVFWTAAAVEKLMDLGKPLKDLIKLLGYTEAKNPILAFLSKKTIIQEFLIPGLINSTTFKALYEAIRLRIIASSEFRRLSDYNLIYCKDFYANNNLANMIGYLKLQGNILKPSAKEYAFSDQVKNKKIFINFSNIKEQEPTKRIIELQKIEDKKLPSMRSNSTKLNSLQLAMSLAAVWDDSPPPSRSLEPDKKTGLILDQFNKEASKFTLEDYAATAQYFITSGNLRVKSILESPKLSSLTIGDILTSTEKIKKIFANVTVTPADLNLILDAVEKAVAG